MNMNWIAVAIESGAWCAIFTVIILITLIIARKNPAMAVLSYPPKIVERLISLGKIKEKKPLPAGIRVLKKLPALLLYIAAFVCLLYFVNGCKDFLSGFLSSFIIMTIWDWYDAFFIDMVLFCNTKLFVLEGTEDMVEEYHDYRHHIKSSCVGMILVVIGSLIIGGITALLGLI